ncbi:LysE family transporter [Iodobacter arcticus]|uniref:LysE family transporter n=1 Tax=Iodobacter arcticus TaxID=590593 RepID=A0ABW2QY86_9NEIS
MNEIFAVALITILAVISPGADFAMVTRNSYLYGRKAGLLAALGIALGVQIHVMYTMLGVGLIISQSPALFTVIKIAGAIYLIYIGYTTFTSKSKLDIDLSADSGLSPFSALKNGFLTNVLNPKTTLFVVSTYTQVVNPSTPLAQQIGYGLFMSLAHGIWFALVALFFSHKTLRSAMINGQSVLNKIIGSALLGLGVSLAFAPLTH